MTAAVWLPDPELRLLVHHADQLTRSGISHQVAVARGYRSATRPEEMSEAGFAKGQCGLLPALLMPLFSARGEPAGFLARPDKPRVNERGREQKYEGPAGRPPVIDVPPVCRAQVKDPAIPLFITEGTKKGDAAAGNGICCITLQGVWSWRGKNREGGRTALADWDEIALNGRLVYIVFDSDAAEKPDIQKAEDRLAAFLTGRGARVQVLRLPPGEGGSKVGLDDFLLTHEPRDLMELGVTDVNAGAGVEPAKGGREQKSQATRLVEFGRRTELFHAPGAEPELFARLRVGDHWETWPLRSAAFKRWLRHQFFKAEGTAPCSQALQDAMGCLEATAEFEGPEVPVSLRIAEHGGALYLDLCNAGWEVVEVTPDGWQVVSEPPIRFRRTRGMLPLPRPVTGDGLAALRRLVNVRSVDDFRLLVAWLLSVFSAGPYPLIALYGGQGCGKTTCGRLIRFMIDPNEADLRSEPRDVRDLMIAATNGRVIALDNLSHIPDWLSDALCRLATGGAFSTRGLFTDSEERLFTAQRAVLLTGIEEVITRGDLLDRAITLHLETIPEGRRRLERELWREAEALRPVILGSLLTAVSQAMRDHGKVKLERLPRMADFALWSAAGAPACGWTAKEFLDAYDGNRATLHETALEADPLSTPIRELVGGLERGGVWEGTATILRDALGDLVSESVRKARSWPADAARLSGRLRRLAPNLLAEGIVVEFPGGHKPRRIRLFTQDSVPSVPTVPRARPAPEPQDAPASDGDAAPEAGDGDADAGDAPNVPTGAVGDNGDGAARLQSNVVAREPAPSRHAFIRQPDGLAAVRSGLEAAEIVALDVETTGLDPRKDRLRLLTLATERGAWVVDCSRVDPRALFPALSRKRLVIHHGAFDLSFLRQHGFEAGSVTDTLLLAQLLSAGIPSAKGAGYHSLQSCVQRELGELLPKELQKSDWSGALSVEQREYAARDAAVLLPLYGRLCERLREAGLEKAAEIENRCLLAVVWMANSGAPFDVEGWNRLAGDAEADLTRAEAALNAIAPKPPGLDLGQTWNWAAPEQALRALRAAGCELQDTDDASLAGCNHPLAEALRIWRAIAKRVSTYGRGWVAGALADERLFASWRQIGADTGRMACREPNLQNLPRDLRYRTCIAAPPGRVLVKADYAAIELRIAAKIAGEAKMLEAFKAGADLHILTAQALTGNAAVTKAERQLAKAVNFGLLYGMGAAGFQAYALAQFGVSLTTTEAEAARTAFFRQYPGLRQWHRAQSRGELETRTLAGRRRLGVSRFTEKLNTPVQGTGADGLKRAMALLWERRAECPGAIPVLACHDEIVVECDGDQAELAAEWLRRAMVDGMAPLIAPVPVLVEVQTAQTWAG